MASSPVFAEKITETMRVHISSLPQIDDAQVCVRKKRSFRAHVSEQKSHYGGDENLVSMRIRLMKGGVTVHSQADNLENSQLGDFVKSCYEKLEDPERVEDFPKKSLQYEYEYIDVKQPLNHYDDSLFLIEHEEKVTRLRNLLEKVYQKIGSTHCFQVSSSYEEEFIHESLWSLHVPTLLNDKKTHMSASLNIKSNDRNREWNKSIREDNAFFYRIDWSRLLRHGLESLSCFGSPRIRLDAVEEPKFAELSPQMGQVLLKLFFEHLKYCSKNPHAAFDTCELPDESFSSILQVIDDPFLIQRPYSTLWDEEACPTERMLLVREGKLCRLPHNSATASLWGVDASGNAIWNEKSYLDLSCHNLYIDPGRRGGTGADEYDDRVERFFFDHFVGPLNFDVRSGFLKSKTVTQMKLADGERVFLEGSVPFQVNILDLFKSVLRTGRELLWSGRFGSPSIVVNLKKAGIQLGK